MPSDPTLPALFDRASALAAGISRHQISHRVRTGAWTPLARGHYAATADFDALSARDQHLLRLVAVLDRRGDSDVASHLSGAVVHGWGLPFDGPGTPTVTSGDLRRSARRRPELVVQVASLPERDVVMHDATVDGERWSMRVTSPARTLADCLRHLPPEDSVAIADGVLRSGALHLDAVRRALDRQEAWPYLSRGRSALSLVDARRESFLESYSLVRLMRFGVPLAEPQVSIYTPDGEFVARVDGWLPDSAVALEADGAKYLLDGGAAPLESSSAAEVLRRVQHSLQAQYERETRLKALGVTVVRWTTAQAVRDPGRVAGRIRAACGRSRGRAFTGVAVPADPHPSCG
ncbi:MAG: type IV toxin-antitoxin system AbiEi family antitoxin domain-containing protein [Angustibacter sp.]